MLKDKEQSMKHRTKLITGLAKRPVFRVVLMLVISTLVLAMGLTSPQSDPVEKKDVVNAVVSKFSITPYKPFISEETIKFMALEKIFMGSNFYQTERMIPLTVAKGTETFVA